MLDSYTSTFPRPHFWEALTLGRFELPRCDTCDEWQAPGAAKCARCGSERLAWHGASGDGRVYSLLERMAPPGIQPAVIAVVELSEGPTLLASIVGAPPTATVGMRVRVVTETAQSPEGLPLFAESAI
jgi:uncharacterized protein